MHVYIWVASYVVTRPLTVTRGSVFVQDAVALMQYAQAYVGQVRITRYIYVCVCVCVCVYI